MARPKTSKPIAVFILIYLIVPQFTAEKWAGQASLPKNGFSPAVPPPHPILHLYSDIHRPAQWKAMKNHRQTIKNTIWRQ